MANVTTVVLNRDCEAVEIPAGRVSMLPAGTAVDITQTLGGTYTVHANGRLFRVAPQDAEALGFTAGAAVAPAAAGPATAEQAEQAAWEALKTCYDPEIPVNIVDLGLVYDLHFEDLPDGKRRVQVKMTLTAPGCGMGRVIAGDAQQKLMGTPGIDDAEVEIVWEPPWHQSMITAEGRRVLGLE